MKKRNVLYIRDVSEQAIKRFNKQAKARGLKQGYYFDLIMGTEK